MWFLVAEACARFVGPVAEWGKRGGTRVIYYNTLSEGSIWLLIAYTKTKFDNLPTAFLKQLKEEISNGQ